MNRLLLTLAGAALFTAGTVAPIPWSASDEPIPVACSIRPASACQAALSEGFDEATIRHLRNASAGGLDPDESFQVLSIATRATTAAAVAATKVRNCEARWEALGK